MSLMYEVNALNAAMIKAAEVCRQDMPEGEKVNAVLACFAGMKPVEAASVVHAEWIHDINNLYGCSACLGRETMSHKKMKRFCPNCGAQMDAEVPEDGED